MQTINFSDCDRQFLKETFGLVRVLEMPELTNWLSVQEIKLEEYENIVFNKMKNYAALRVDDLSEYEHFGKLISPIFNFAELDTDDFRFFAQRDIAATVGDIQLRGRVDGMVASGSSQPRLPFFCLNEFKKSLDAPGDPAGQCLAAMLAAQTLNNNNLSIFGIYIMGRNWYFTILKEKKYAISREFDESEEDIFDIVKILKKLKINIVDTMKTLS